jgi:hypothetical protein
MLQSIHLAALVQQAYTRNENMHFIPLSLFFTTIKKNVNLGIFILVRPLNKNAQISASKIVQSKNV